MARIVLLEAGRSPLRLDAGPAEICAGYRNVLPGFHELRARGDGDAWLGAALVVQPEDTAILRLRDGRWRGRRKGDRAFEIRDDVDLGLVLVEGA